MKAYDAVQRDMAKLQADLDRVRVFLVVPCAIICAQLGGRPLLALTMCAVCCPWAQAKALKDPATGEIGGDEVRQAIADDYAKIKRDTETQVHPDLGTFDHKFFRAD